MFITSAIIAWILRDHGYKALTHVGDMSNCEGKACTGTGIVLRLSLAMVLLSTFLGLSVIGVENTSNARAFIQNQYFGVKWLMLGGTAAGCLFLSNESAVQFGYVAAVGAGFFLFFGILLVLEFAYGWNDSWVAKYDETSEKIWAIGVLVAAFLCYASSIVSWGLIIHYFGGHGCSHTTGFITVTIIMSVAITLLTLPAKIQQGALLPCGVIVLYGSWLCASAVMSIPVDNTSECEARHSHISDTSRRFMESIGVIFTIFCVGYATIRAASSGQDLTGAKPRPDAALLDNEKGEEAKVTAEEDESDTVQYNYSFFHLVYALGAMYLAMVLLNWQVGINEKDGKSVGDMSDWANVWIKVTSQWATYLLYIWTLIAPLVCSCREFS
jgi:hypothetical protein